MKKLLPISALMLFFYFLQGCTKQTISGPVEQMAEPSSAVKPTGLQSVSLIVELQSSYTAAPGTIQSKINSDNGQQYMDGIDYVKAQIDQNGNFSFTTNASKNSLAKRFVVYDLSDPVDPINTYSPAFGRGYYNQYNYIFTTSASQYGSTFIPLQNLLLNQSECIALTGNINGDGVNSIFKYTVRFHATKDDLSDSPTAFAVVTRTADNEWEIEPASCSTPNDVGALWTGDSRNEVFKGDFHLPFSFRLAKR